MTHKLPDPDDSRRSWESIWLGCIDAKFYCNKGTQKTMATGMTEWQKTRPRCNQHPKSIHQNSCGEGFDHKERAQLNINNATMQWITRHSATPLGSNPRELADWIIKKRLPF